jgi:hypothetical protein
MTVTEAALILSVADDPGRAAFVLSAIGLILCIAGPLLVSRLPSEPNYDVMLA